LHFKVRLSRLAEIVEHLLKDIGDRFGLHSHDSFSLGLSAVLKAAKLGQPALLRLQQLLLSLSQLARVLCCACTKPDLAAVLNKYQQNARKLRANNCC
jgi:hypothetical protein